MALPIPFLPAIVAAAGVAQLARLAVPWHYRDLYLAIGPRYAVDPNLLHALAIHESHENPLAISPPNPDGTRDYGLMQINSSNFAGLGLDEHSALIPERSIAAAAQLLADNLRRAPKLGFLDQLAVYNAGLSKWGPRPKLTTSGAYINQAYVMNVATWYGLVVVATLAPVQRT